MKSELPAEQRVEVVLALLRKEEPAAQIARLTESAAIPGLLIYKDFPVSIVELLQHLKINHLEKQQCESPARAYKILSYKSTS